MFDNINLSKFIHSQIVSSNIDTQEGHLFCIYSVSSLHFPYDFFTHLPFLLVHSICIKLLLVAECISSFGNKSKPREQ